MKIILPIILPVSQNSNLNIGKKAGGPMDTLINMIPKLVAVIIILMISWNLTAKAMQPVDPAYNSEKIKECNERWKASLGDTIKDSDDLDKDDVIDYCDTCVLDPALGDAAKKFTETGGSKNFVSGAPNDHDKDGIVDGCDSNKNDRISTLKYLGSFDKALEAECKKVAATIKGKGYDVNQAVDKGEGITKCQIRAK